MADKELRRMNRTELIEIIYALQQNERQLREENEKLKKQMDERILRLEKAGSIAEAALSLNHIFEDAEKAAGQYLASLEEAERNSALLQEETRQEAEKTVEDARRRADEILEDARSKADEILKEARRTADESQAGSAENAEQILAEAKRKADELLAETEQEIERRKSEFVNTTKHTLQRHPELVAQIRADAKK